MQRGWTTVRRGRGRGRADTTRGARGHTRPAAGMPPPLPDAIGDTAPEHYLERFSRRTHAPKDEHQSFGKQASPALKLNATIREYVRATTPTDQDLPFLHIPEIPTSAEISVPESDEALEIPLNHVVGPHESKRKYLSDHYVLLREDGVSPLRNVVSELKAEPHVMEQDSVERSYIYEKVANGPEDR
ncbi:MAG: hypothetical protein Q9222_000067 [Ikaeria aurantiellina]